MIVIEKKTGRLGNNLTVFAHFIACAIENKLTIVNPAFLDYAHYFEKTSDDVLCRYPHRSLNLIYDDKIRKLLYISTRFIARGYRRINKENFPLIISNFPKDNKWDLSNRDFVELAQTKIVFCQGYHFRDYKNVARHADKIRSYFVPANCYLTKVKNFIFRIRDEYEIVIGIHIRQSDYKQYRNGQFFYETSSYVRVMQEVKSLFNEQKVAFLICSSTQQDEECFFEFNAFISKGNMLEDLYLLSRCDYIIGPPSSFSRWASFYGRVPLGVLMSSNQKLSLSDFKVNEQLLDHFGRYPSKPASDKPQSDCTQ